MVLSFDGESIEQYFLMITLREFSVTWAIVGCKEETKMKLAKKRIVATIPGQQSSSFDAKNVSSNSTSLASA